MSTCATCDGYFFRRPAIEQRFEEVAAYLAVEPADPVDPTAAVDGEVGHIKGFGGVVRVLTSQRQ